ncbi:MAG: hypothetical protein P4M15_02695, partial [Alphaproteobacteria bacterium]|nr:hypothetical protein [Alphaproteobacteria bacterium]
GCLRSSLMFLQYPDNLFFAKPLLHRLLLLRVTDSISFCLRKRGAGQDMQSFLCTKREHSAMLQTCLSPLSNSLVNPAAFPVPNAKALE